MHTDYAQMLARFARHPDAFAAADTPEAFADLVTPEGETGDGAVIRMYVAKGDTWTRRLFQTAKAHGLTTCPAQPLYMPDARSLSDIVTDVRFLPNPPGGLTYEEHRDANGGRSFMSGHRSGGNVPALTVGGVCGWSPEWLAKGERLRSRSGGVFHSTYGRLTEAAQSAWDRSMGYPDKPTVELIQWGDGRVLVTLSASHIIGSIWLALLDGDKADAAALMPDEDRAKIAAARAAEAAAWEEVTPGLPRIVHEGRSVYWEVAPGVYNATADRDTPPKGAAGYLSLAALCALKGDPAPTEPTPPAPAQATPWTVSGADRKEGAQGVSEPFAVEVMANDRDDAQEKARAARYDDGREHVLIKAAAPALTAKRGHVLTIGAEVMAVLASATAEGDLIRLNCGQLERSLYAATDKALTLAGGKWNRARGGHVFKTDAAAVLDDLLTVGQVRDTKSERQAFYTPAALAAHVVGLAQIGEGMKVLEPSAGGGALVAEIVKARGNVWAYEIDAAARADLVSRFFSQFGAGGCVAGDFLAVEPNPVFDRIVMNPPFSRQDDARHVSHAFSFLKPGGRLVAIMSASAPHRRTGPGRDFLALVDRYGGTFERVEAGAFKESGTMVETVILTLDRPAD